MVSVNFLITFVRLWLGNSLIAS